MKHINITIEKTGDLISAISESLAIAKAVKEDLHLILWPGKHIRISHESYVQDLITIGMLETELKKAKEQAK